MVTVTLCGSSSSRATETEVDPRRNLAINHHQCHDHTPIYCMLGIWDRMLTFVVQLSLIFLLAVVNIGGQHLHFHPPVSMVWNI